MIVEECVIETLSLLKYVSTIGDVSKCHGVAQENDGGEPEDDAAGMCVLASANYFVLIVWDEDFAL